MLKSFNYKRNKKDENINITRSYLLKEVYEGIKFHQKTTNTKINEITVSQFKKKFENFFITMENESYNFDSNKNKEGNSFNFRGNNNNKNIKKFSEIKEKEKFEEEKIEMIYKDKNNNNYDNNNENILNFFRNFKDINFTPVKNNKQSNYSKSKENNMNFNNIIETNNSINETNNNNTNNKIRKNNRNCNTFLTSKSLLKINSPDIIFNKTHKITKDFSPLNDLNVSKLSELSDLSSILKTELRKLSFDGILQKKQISDKKNNYFEEKMLRKMKQKINNFDAFNCNKNNNKLSKNLGSNNITDNNFNNYKIEYLKQNKNNNKFNFYLYHEDDSIFLSEKNTYENLKENKNLINYSINPEKKIFLLRNFIKLNDFKFEENDYDKNLKENAFISHEYLKNLSMKLKFNK